MRLLWKRVCQIAWAHRWGVYCAALLLLGAPLAQARDVRLGVYENPPKVMLSTDGRADGIFGGLMAAIAQREGWNVVAVPCQWEACLEALQAGRIDLLPDVARTAEREKRFDFHTTPVLHSWSDLYVRSSDPIRSLLDLKGKRIAVLEGSVQQNYLRELFKGFGIDVRLLPVKSFEEGFSLVARGQADAAAANYNYGEANARRFELLSSSIMFLPSELFFASTRGENADLLAAIDRNLTQWQREEDSPYYRVMRQWKALPPATVWSLWLKWAVVGVVVAGVFVMAIITMLRRQVRAQTARLQEDLVRLQRADQALSRQHDLFLSLIRTIPDLIWLKDTEGVYLACNPRFESFFGAKEADIVGKTDHDFVDRDLADFFRAKDRAAMQAGKSTVNEEWLTFAADGYHGLFETTKTPMLDAAGRIIGVLGIAHDMTERKRIENQIEHLAYHDQLTGLPNRSLFLDRLAQEVTAAGRHQRFGAVMFVDLDQFKHINDVHGHATGDEVLKQVALRLRQHLRSEDTVARFGGDEFVILLPELSGQEEAAATQAFAVADKVRVALEQPVGIDGVNHLSTASIGVALFPKAGASADDLVREADIALYRAKDGGRNAVVFFQQDMQERIAEQYALERELREAIQAGELELFVQSQVSADGTLAGAEALVRWRHPVRGLVPPAAFIPLAEKSGLIVAIGEWVLREACRLLVSLCASGHRLHLSVNVSPRQFRQPDFVSRVQSILAETGADPSCLMLEITENLLIEKADEVAQRMRALAELGIRFAVDDFGTGYSSLSYLKRLPLDQIKIDKSFVQDVPHDANDVALIEAILSMAQHLKFEVVAEGVETREQLDLLVTHGCRLFQGFYFHRPRAHPEWLADALATARQPTT